MNINIFSILEVSLEGLNFHSLEYFIKFKFFNNGDLLLVYSSTPLFNK